MELLKKLSTLGSLVAASLILIPQADFAMLDTPVVGTNPTLTTVVKPTSTLTVTPTALAPVTLTTPKAGATLSGSVTVSAVTSPSAPVARAQFHLVAATGTQPAILADWRFTKVPADGIFTATMNTAAYPNGSYTIYFDYFDAAEVRSRSANISVTIANSAPAPIKKPVLTNPVTGTTLSGTISLSVTADPRATTTRAQFHLVPTGGTEVVIPKNWRFTSIPSNGVLTTLLDTKAYPNGTYTIYFDYYDAANTRYRTANADVTIDNSLLKITPTGETIADYYPQIRKGGLLVVKGDLNAKASEFALVPFLSTGKYEITWGNPNNWPADPITSVEEFEFKKNCFDGKDFVWLNAYRDYNLGFRYEIETTKAEMKIGDGAWVDITSAGTCGKVGQPYYLTKVIKETQVIRVWGKVYDKDHKGSRDFYWQNTMTPSPAVTNSCWQVDKNKTKPALLSQEAWWDKDSGWTLGSGTLGVDGKPTGANVTYGRQNSAAKGVGLGWTTLYPNTKEEYCLSQWWSW